MAAQDKSHIGAHGVRLNKGLGITERIAPKMESWTGETRVRFTDFQVNEISKDGTIVHLKETKLVEPPSQPAPASAIKPEESKSEDVKEGTDDAQSNGNAQNGAAPPKDAAESIPEPADEDIKTITELTSVDFAESLLAIYRAAAAKKTIPPPARSPPLEDKDKRGQLHQHVRRVFRSLIDTTTDTSDPSLAGSVIVATGRPPRPSKAYNQANRMKSNNRRNAKGKVKTEGEGDYLHFTLYKENRDTMDAIHQLARAGRAKPQHFAFAGTKDRRAATSQRCSVRWLKAENLHGVQARVHGLVTGDYRYEKSPLHLGALQGNEFVITLKKCHISSPAAEAALTPAAREAAIRTAATAALDSMASRGWLNYFGHQRFGTYAVGTHEVGRYILQEDFEGAVNAILTYKADVAQRALDGEDPPEAHLRDDLNRHRACMVFQTDAASADEALHYLPRRFTAECAVIRHLGRNPESRRDFHGALNAIPRQLRNMYLHAYQSYVWNHAASHRWAAHADTVVEGDLVLVEAPAKPDAPTAPSDDPELVLPPPTNDDDEPDEPTTARPLSAAEAASGAFTIHDVVLPSPGHAVTYPPNALGAFYVDFMARPENGALDPHAMTRRHRDFSLPGHYRRLTARFLGVPAVEVRRYRDEEEQMHPTDLDRVRAAQAADAAAAAQGRKRKWDEEQAQTQAQDKKARLEGQTDEVLGDAPAPVPAAEEAKLETPAGDGKTEAEPAEASGEDAERTKVAVIVKFQLGKSAYATVALRELMGEEDEEINEAPAASA